MTMKIDEIRELANILKETGLCSIEVEDGDFAVSLKMPTASAPATAVPVAPAALTTASAAPAADAATGRMIPSPMVGMFYTSPGPDSPSFISVGDTIKKGDVLCIIEAMKLMNEITAEEGGVIDEILVENGQVVEFGQPLFRLR